MTRFPHFGAFTRRSGRPAVLVCLALAALAAMPLLKAGAETEAGGGPSFASYTTTLQILEGASCNLSKTATQCPTQIQVKGLAPPGTITCTSN